VFAAPVGPVILPRGSVMPPLNDESAPVTVRLLDLISGQLVARRGLLARSAHAR
jgi:hypothetical protein